MSIKVVLTMLPFSNHIFTPPIQLAYLKGYLQQDKDVDVRILDLETYCFSSSLINSNSRLYWERIWSGEDSRVDNEIKPLLDDMVRQILSQNPRVVGFSVTNTNHLLTNYVSQQIRKADSNIYIICGGRRFCLRQRWRPHIANLHGELPDVDCIIKNEGEATLREIVTILKTGRQPSYCKGATLRLDGKIVDSSDRMPIEDIDSIPFPDFSDFSKQDYLSDYIRILFYRGCAGRCSFCVENDMMGYPVRYRSVQNIIDEIKLRIQQGYKRFQSCDLALNSNAAHLEKLCQSIVNERLNIEFTFGEFSHSSNLKRGMLNLLREAGFKTVIFGTESGSQNILNKMRKTTTIDVIERNIRDAHEAQLKVILYLMVGFPGETEETFLETLSLLRDNKNYIDAIGFAAPTNVCWGSGIHENLKDYDVDVDTLFKNPDRWKSKDCCNYLEWRQDPSRRALSYSDKIGIPLADIMIDGNPLAPVNLRRA